jgi:hypothetical protein
MPKHFIFEDDEDEANDLYEDDTDEDDDDEMLA